MRAMEEENREEGRVPERQWAVAAAGRREQSPRPRGHELEKVLKVPGGAPPPRGEEERGVRLDLAARRVERVVLGLDEDLRVHMHKK